MDQRRYRTLLAKALFLFCTLLFTGCSDHSFNKSLPWWDSLTEDTVLAFKSSQIPKDLLSKMPAEVSGFAEEYLAGGATIRIRIEEGSVSEIVDYWEVSLMVQSNTPLESTEDSKLLSAYRSAISPVGWEIRVLLAEADSTAASEKLEKAIKSHNEVLIAQVGAELDSRELRPKTLEADASSSSLLIEDGLAFLQLGELPPGTPTKGKKLIQDSYAKPLPTAEGSRAHFISKLFISTPKIEQSPSPKIPSWTPGHKAVNKAIEDVLKEWESIAGNSTIDSLTEIRISTTGISAKTLVDTSSSPWLDFQSVVKEKLEWTTSPDALVHAAFLSPIGQQSPFSAQFTELFIKQMSLISLPSVLESSVLMTEAEADENVKKNLGLAQNKVRSLIGELSKSTAKQVNFALWTSPIEGENMALWVNCSSAESFAKVTGEITALVAEWTGLDLSEDLRPVPLDQSEVSAWVLGSNPASKSSDLYVGIDLSSQTASVSTSTPTLIQSMTANSGGNAETFDGLFKLVVNAARAASRVEELSDGVTSEDLVKIQDALKWIGSLTISAKIADAQTLELDINTSGK